MPIPIQVWYGFPIVPCISEYLKVPSSVGFPLCTTRSNCIPRGIWSGVLWRSYFTPIRHDSQGMTKASVDRKLSCWHFSPLQRAGPPMKAWKEAVSSDSKAKEIDSSIGTGLKRKAVSRATSFLRERLCQRLTQDVSVDEAEIRSKYESGQLIKVSFLPHKNKRSVRYWSQ